MDRNASGLRSKSIKMKKLKLLLKTPNNKGQSFMELAIVMLFLIALLFGMAEFGNLLNQYINLVDGTREAARFASQTDPIKDGNTQFCNNIFVIINGTGIPNETTAIDPIKLDGTANDAVVASYYTVEQTVSGGIAQLLHECKWGDTSRTSAIDTADIQPLLNSNAPSTGILVVEIFYQYQPIFGFFDASAFNAVHAYSIMPLSAAEPTPTPEPPS